MEAHRALGARLVAFAGWEMPVQYSGVVEEHRAVRNAAGLFDLSHMGEVEISGDQALEFLNHSLTNDASRLDVGSAQYTLITYTDGTVADDAILYRLPGRYLLVVNASNREKDLDWLQHQALGYPGAVLRDASDDTALVAIQGPASEQILLTGTTLDLSQLGYYKAVEGEAFGVPAVIARTGYTGEDGFELFVSPHDAPRLWDMLLERGRRHGLVPVGLGARDTLRLEAGMALYGHELDESINPFEAGLGWAVKLTKGDFVGKEALEREKALGPQRKLVGFELEERGVPRSQQAMLKDGEQIGFVTSGTYSPTFQKPIGLGYVPTRYAKVGEELQIEVRGRAVPARVVPTPFYRRGGGVKS